MRCRVTRMLDTWSLGMQARPLGLCSAILLTGLAALPLGAQELPRAEVAAPEGHAVFRRDVGAAYFVAKSLKKKHDSLVARVRHLKADIREARIDEKQAQAKIAELQGAIRKTLAEIEKKQVYVSAVAVHKSTATQSFELGKAGCLQVEAGNVRIVGWDQPRVKCVLEKRVFNVKGEPVDADLAGIRAEHSRVPAAKVPGGSFKQLAGGEIDMVRVTGLTSQEGNRQFVYELTSKGGEGISGSEWRRHASLTVYVPTCKMVVVRGALEGLQVESVHAALEIVGIGNRDYQATYRVKDHHGPLKARGVPMQILEKIRGNVSIVLTGYRENSSTPHKGGRVTFRHADPGQYRYVGIQGDFRGWFCRASLHLEDVTGKIDVRNDFGHTFLVCRKRLTHVDHRVVSESGDIQVDLGPGALGDLPVTALTECGSVQLATSEASLRSSSFSTAGVDMRGRRSWGGLVTDRGRSPARPGPGWREQFSRPADALAGRPRSPGLDLISRAGRVRIGTAKAVGPRR